MSFARILKSFWEVITNFQYHNQFQEVRSSKMWALNGICTWMEFSIICYILYIWQRTFQMGLFMVNLFTIMCKKNSIIIWNNTAVNNNARQTRWDKQKIPTTGFVSYTLFPCIQEKYYCCTLTGFGLCHSKWYLYLVTQNGQYHTSCWHL